MRAGKLFLIWTCLFSIALIGSAQQKGRSRNRRALYSSPSSPEEIKYVVRIETFYSADRVTVLLNESIVLTAAHCIYRNEQETPIGYLIFSNGQMVSGGLFARHSNYKYANVDEMPVSPDFICSDVALLFLNTPIKIPPTSKKLVVDCSHVYSSGQCASHGAAGKLSQKILKVPLPKIHLSRNFPFNNRACFETKYTDKERLCQGDSGGPVICSVKNDVFSVIGVSVQVISYDMPKKPNSTTETCQISFGSIVSNTVALRQLIKSLPSELKTRVQESVHFENCET